MKKIDFYTPRFNGTHVHSSASLLSYYCNFARQCLNLVLGCCTSVISIMKLSFGKLHLNWNSVLTRFMSVSSLSQNLIKIVGFFATFLVFSSSAIVLLNDANIENRCVITVKII
jgi:hypothetical protein